MDSFNDRINERIIEHQVELERLTVAGTREVLKRLQTLQEKLLALLVQIDPSGAVYPANQKKRLEQLIKEANKAIGDTYYQMASHHASLMTDYGYAESQIFVQIYNEEAGGALIHPVLTKEAVTAIASDLMFEGATTAEWWRKQSTDFKYRFKAEMTEGVMEGEDIGTLTRRVRDSMNIPHNNAEALARTGYHNIFQDVRRRTYEGNSDIIQQVMWLATLDTRTSPICRVLDNRRWKLDDEKTPVGHGMKWKGWPPAHWNCRSTTTPVTPSWNELIENPDVARILDKLKPQYRESMDGKVPADMSYNDWLKKQPAERQKQVLGPKRYELWKDGKITNVNQLIDQRGNPLTLDELYKKYGKPK